MRRHNYHMIANVSKIPQYYCYVRTTINIVLLGIHIYDQLLYVRQFST